MNQRLLAAMSLSVLMLSGCDGKSARVVSRLRSTADAASASQGLNQKKQGLVGDSAADGLQSLQYFIESIRICENLQTMGTGYSSESGCLELYRSEEDVRYQMRDVSSNYANLADVARTDTTNFVDLMDATSRARLNSTVELSEEAARSYAWGIISWSLPIKVKAEVSLSDGSKLYTRDGTTQGFVDNNPGAPPGYWYQTTANAALANGPAETATVIMPNGGTWFRFQNPFVVTADDVSRGESFELDLAFNPQGLVKGDSGPTTNRPPLVDSSGAALYVPFLDLSPVPHRSGEAVVREKYVANVSTRSPWGNTHSFDLRLELYSLASDANRSIYAASITTLATAATTFGPPEIQKISFLEQNSDGTINFQAWDRGNMISNFARAANVGETAAASLGCGGNGQMRTFDCPSQTASSIPLSFVLVERVEL